MVVTIRLFSTTTAYKPLIASFTKDDMRALLSAQMSTFNNVRLLVYFFFFFFGVDAGITSWRHIIVQVIC